MIIGNLKNFAAYAEAEPCLVKIQEFVKTHDLAVLPCGKYEICGNEIYVNIQEYFTKAYGECRFETHEKYADVQCILSGREFIWADRAEQLEELTQYDEQADIQFWMDGKKPILVGLEENQFVFLAPGEAHKPCVCAGENSKVKKAVFKIRIEN